MLFIKGIYLLLSHLPTSHTTVRAVRHTAVSCFYTLRCVASCFQPSLRDTSLLFYCRIPSYRVNREFLFGHLTTKDSQGSSHLLLHCTIQSFPIDNPCLGYYDLRAAMLTTSRLLSTQRWLSTVAPQSSSRRQEVQEISTLLTT